MSELFQALKMFSFRALHVERFRCGSRNCQILEHGCEIRCRKVSQEVWNRRTFFTSKIWI